MNKFYAKLGILMTILGVGAIYTAACVPYWSSTHTDQGDVSVGLFTCTYIGTDHSTSDCHLTYVWKKIPDWFQAVRALVIISGVLASLIFALLISYVCREAGNQRCVITTVLSFSLLAGVTLLTAVILAATKFSGMDNHLNLGWAFGLAIGATVDFAIMAVPLCFEKQTIRTYETL